MSECKSFYNQLKRFESSALFSLLHLIKIENNGEETLRQALPVCGLVNRLKSHNNSITNTAINERRKRDREWKEIMVGVGSG